MRTATLPIPEIGLLAATRTMAGVGAALLLASRIDESKRNKIGWPLLALGTLSTIPLAMDIIRRSKRAEAEEAVEEDATGI